VNTPSKPFWAVADAYLFDIDGTLLNTRDGVHYHAFHHAVQKIFGVDSHIDGVPVHGSTDVAILRAVLRREGLQDANFEARLPEAIAQMTTEVCAHASAIRTELCPAIPELLETLRRKGKLLGVVTGNLESIGWTKLTVAGLRPLFQFGCFCDRHELREDIFRQGVQEVRRRLGPTASICVVADTPSDIHAAQAVGIPIIALATGIFDAEQLKTLHPDACFSSGTELLPYF
jgi:phosphoglycolate phosphatase-like HAD superfamily hydrolase